VVLESLADFLRQARTLGVQQLDAQLLLCRVLSQPRSWLLAHDDYVLGAAQIEPLLDKLTRRACGEPLAYLLGEKEFYGLMLSVSSAVLIPRPDTETLVDWALELLRKNPHPSARVIDLGTGSGAIALAVKKQCPHAAVSATDVSLDALAVARGNAQRHALEVDFFAGSWWQAVPGQRFDLALSNPPYIAALDPHLAALGFEPRMALTPGGDGVGLQALQAIVQAAAQHLHPGAWLVLEHGFDQAEQVAEMLLSHGFLSVSTRFDLGGNARCTAGRCITTKCEQSVAEFPHSSPM
jgi:release factor glutamine methyltransferase